MAIAANGQCRSAAFKHHLLTVPIFIFFLLF